MKNPSRIAIVAGSLLVSLLAVGACVSEENARKVELAVGKSCTLNSECTEPNICVYGRCHAQCATSADCAFGERCMSSEVPGAGVCQLASEASCEGSSGCPGKQACAVDGQCRDLCESATDCIGDQVCTQATCAEPSEVDAETGKLPEKEGHTGTGQACQYNSDCPNELLCVNSMCGPECRGSKDCPSNKVCADNFCVDCAADTDCSSGQSCLESRCVDCVEDSQCAAGLTCEGNVCTGCGPNATCAEGSFCVDKTCVECVSDAQCGAGACLNHACVECISDVQCGESGACVGKRCVECGSDSDCASGHCSKNKCVECFVSGDCAGTEVCTPENECVECAIDADCELGNYCQANACVGGCKSDDNCKAGQRCIDEACVAQVATLGGSDKIAASNSRIFYTQGLRVVAAPHGDLASTSDALQFVDNVVDAYHLAAARIVDTAFELLVLPGGKSGMRHCKGFAKSCPTADELGFGLANAASFITFDYGAPGVGLGYQDTGKPQQFIMCFLATGQDPMLGCTSQVVVTTTDLSQATGFAVKPGPKYPAGTLYVAYNTGKIASYDIETCSKASCVAPTVVDTGSSQIGPLELNGDELYWVDMAHTAIDHCDVNACTPARLTSGVAAGTPLSKLGLAVGGGYAYWRDTGFWRLPITP